MIPPAVLDRPVSGAQLVPGTLRDQLGGEGELRLLVFLRHFGCVFCREAVGDLRALADAQPGFPPVLFFTQGSPTESRLFLRRDFPGARAVSDPELFFYEAFGVTRGSLLRMLGPAVWSARSRAVAKGYRGGERSGDIWRMPGLFLVRGDRVLWAHEYRHAGDLPDYERIASEARAAAGAA